MFRIEIQKSYWIQGREDDPKDLCLHGDVVFSIFEEVLYKKENNL